ncbi:hypothetical protein K469DRAFT_712522 [Zopfia rhizophila CBS 207.26]|uniref:Uncharacterized protein n=1 Tax=Zopfia rhizophila CBS 207.26 TaxID=1314779 RepID=A0A6A6ER28_9PEZI|nr:hypothetical protein K469DRAFT_712522 [Zopfia rhizophila CBS 207.26]
MSRNPGPIRRLWYNWKMMRLPWRRKWLVGFDLQGNTFWEFKDALHANRNRRIVKYSRWTHHGDVNVPPQWMQWLRNTRFEPPSLAEQQADVVRQERIKLLAAQADERWASKPSFLDPPDKQQPIQMLVSRDSSTGGGQMNANQQVRDEADPPRTLQEQETALVGGQNIVSAPPLKKFKVRTEPKDSPWKQPTRSNSGDDWQPESWTPSPARRRAS